MQNNNNDSHVTDNQDVNQSTGTGLDEQNANRQDEQLDSRYDDESDLKYKTKLKQENSNNTESTSHPLRQLFFFQIKLLFDALRDVLLSPISIVATAADLIEGRRGQNSYFERLMRIGRRSDRHISLFGQDDSVILEKSHTVDSLLTKVEEIVIKEYQNGDISEKTKTAITKRIKEKLSRL
ncbi:hypothetical protein [Aliikangiella maris]|uniref:Uncharacterized protein n=2 Tax=Aliikangiella maris TaxID=3162458 RepID=A0ABV2BTS1_9GAMM